MIGRHFATCGKTEPGCQCNTCVHDDYNPRQPAAPGCCERHNFPGMRPVNACPDYMPEGPCPTGPREDDTEEAKPDNADT